MGLLTASVDIAPLPAFFGVSGVAPKEAGVVWVTTVVLGMLNGYIKKMLRSIS